MASPYFVDENRPWFSKEAGWPDEVPKNVEFPEMTLGEILREAGQKYPDITAIWFLDSTLTYRELDEKVDRMATALARLGLKKGDVVALLLPNSHQYVITYYACARLGLIATGCNPTYKPGEIRHQLRMTRAKAIVVLDALFEPLVAPILKETEIKYVIATNIVDVTGMFFLKRMLGLWLKKIPSGPVPPDSLWFNDLLEAPPEPPKVEISAHDPATYIMTGGTTGVPKAAVLSHFNCVSNAIQAGLWLYKVQPGAMNVGVLPLFHSFAMTCVMNISVRIGCMMLLFPKPPPMDELCARIAELSPPQGAAFCGAEVLFKKLADFPDVKKYNLGGKLTLCVSGAGPLHRPVQEAFEAITGARLVEGYGLTESSPVVSAGPFWGERKIGCIGLPFPGTEWRIVDPANPMRTLPQGESGEIAVAGPQVMVGYLDRPEDTAETIVEMDGKRWLLTGDIGFMDPQGRVTINDRKKQLIKFKGYSVFPTEVETLMMNHPDVSEVAVAGLPDAESGEVIKAWVVLRSEAKGRVTAEDLLAWAKDNLTHYKVPRHVELRDELPKSLVGKVQKRQLQEADPIWLAARKK